MRFWLIVKQAVRDFKSKLQLYISFIIFLLVCLSIIIGMLSFCHVYVSTFDNVFTNTGYTQNQHLPSFWFVDKNGEKMKDSWSNTNPKSHFLYDKNGKFQDYVMDVLQGKDYDGYEWGPSLSSDQISALTDEVKNETNSNRDNIINTIGFNKGYTNWNLVTDIYNRIPSEDKEKFSDIAPDKLTPKLLSESGEGQKIYDELFVQNTPYNNDANMKEIKYYSFIKLNRITTPTLDDMVKNSKARFYNGCLTDKYVIDKKITGEYAYGYNVIRNWPQAPYKDTKGSMNISLLPSEQWMDDAAGSITPAQFRKNDITNIWIKSTMKHSEIPTEVLKNRTYGYLTPSFMHAHDIKIGDTIPNNLVSDSTGFVNDNLPPITIIGEAISRDGWYSNPNLGNLYLPIQFLDSLQSMGKTNNVTDKNHVSKYYSVGNTFGQISLYDKMAGDDLDQAVRDVESNLFDDFTIGDGHTDLYGGAYNFVNKWNDFQHKQLNANVLLFKILSYVISAGVAVLLIVVFWFIAAESIKLQKKTLWFLKALGQGRFTISLLPTIGIMMPLLIGAVASIFGSLFVNNIMSGAIGTSYAFYLPVWSFTVYSFVVLLIIIAISFVIFLALSYIQLAGGALSIHSDTKVGWITKLYMKTKGIYAKLPTSGRIGVAFIVQNIMKNILTLILLLISFAVVLFSMQFGSSARASAHSYEKRNAPYKSLMLNKQNNVDAVQLDEGYVDKELHAPKNVQWALPALSSEISGLFGEGYSTSNINNSNENENEVARDAFGNQDNPIVLAKSRIDSDDTFKAAMDAGVIDVYNLLNDPDLNVQKDLKPEDAFYNKYISQDYMANTMLSDSVDSTTLSEKLFGINDEGWVPGFADSLVSGNDIKILNNLHNHGVIDDQVYYILLGWLFQVNNEPDASIKMQTAIKDTLKYAAVNFANTIDGMRSTYNAARNALKLDKIPLNVYFDKVIVPKNLESSYITDLMYNGNNISGFGLDSRDQATYKRIVKPLSDIKEMSVEDMTSDDNLIKYEYVNQNNAKVSLNAHHIDGYISGNFATSNHISKGDVIDVKATRLPIPGIAKVNSLDSYPDVFIKVRGIVEESSVYQEIYFNKIDLFNYVKASIENDWITDIRNQKDDNSSIGDQSNKNNNHSANKKLAKVDPDDLTFPVKREIYYLDEIINQIKSDQPDAMYTLNNSVFSEGNIPYGFSHWTMNTKTGIGYTILDYVQMPIFDYSSSAYPLNYTNSLYIFNLISQELMRTIQPIISTLDKFVTILLILAFVVALILINLVLWENKPTILLFKAMGYKKREIDGYLLSGYIIADCLGLLAGILISYFGIRYAGQYAFSMLKVSLYFVWSWQFIVTAIAMAVIFIITIILSVNWYTYKQKPRDAFNTL